MKVGETILRPEDIVINEGLETRQITVTNEGDRPIQVGSHFHFFESNRFLSFDREAAFGFRLDIPSGTAIRFEPQETKTVDLVRFGGTQQIHGFNNLTDGQINPTTKCAALEKAKAKGFIR